MFKVEKIYKTNFIRTVYDLFVCLRSTFEFVKLILKKIQLICKGTNENGGGLAVEEDSLESNVRDLSRIMRVLYVEWTSLEQEISELKITKLCVLCVCLIKI